MAKDDKKVIPLPVRREDRHIEEVGRILTHHEIGDILSSILEKAVQNTGAEGGTIFFIERVKQDTEGGEKPAFKKVLRFYRSINRHGIPQESYKARYVEINSNSIAGHVAVTAKSLRIRDCYLLPERAPF